MEEIKRCKQYYTEDELNLNLRLYEECCKNSVDVVIVEELLQQGADPLGPFIKQKYVDFVFDRLIVEGDIASLTPIFLKHGMDINKPRIPYSDDFNCNPLFSFHMFNNERTAVALKLLLDSGMNKECFQVFWGCFVGDLIYVDNFEPLNENCFNEYIWGFRKILLGASYEHILHNDADLARFVCLSSNNYDVSCFRDWNRFYYVFDCSREEGYYDFCKLKVRVFEQSTCKEVWCIDVEKYLKDG